ncbi:MAG: DUF4465 domain-containing protein [Bacteroidaceae bacterium]|nr:DUF4465 domain-containing protein [Bacteroidaceae bacterium]
MKKLLFMSAAAFCLCTLSVTFTSCGNDDEKPNPEQPSGDQKDKADDYQPAPATETTQLVSFEGNYFTALIDNPQYGGPQLYPQDPEAPLYTWTDEITTLSSTLTDAWGDKQYWGGGIAISNYIDADLANGDSDHQLAVTTSNGSSNFAVVNGTSYMTLKTPKVIKSMEIMNTTYALNVIKNGNAYAQALTEPGTYFEVQVTGYKAKQQTATLKFDLARDGVAVEAWKTVDMTSLNEVDSVVFEFFGSDSGDYGLNTPAYFALDNVVIKQ